ncbi:S-adenosyl-L-methionine-dependent methyltransferase [Podospora aff. communis PSN243]|uniref:tRNA wybutosine-synthesizing protein 2 n=1 Tax=Podospora aff. communis PSN243 TaxID=3040156 RepID=A0AAV9GZ46_9PEZI|nr:S-adenosyl-L-methionine-dependent methyltransferase [Podospora aff. communis PSN243]
MDTTKRPPKKPKTNSITAAITTWLSTLPTPIPPNEFSTLLHTSPKRWSVYEPLILLPSGSFTSSPWAHLLSSLPPAHLTPLWTAILANISPSSKTPLTHLAINEGIPLHNTSNPEATANEQEEEENLLRSPSSLRPLHGDFGPPHPTSPPSEEDFAKAFWVSTKQNGITQMWAPRWTMFSRGNVKEKARVLGFRSAGGGKEKWAVDLYAGIGYFVFSYVKMGMRVLCWELNAWSVEGLRRGAEANGWGVRVVRGDELEEVRMEELVRGEEEIVVFLEDNKEARRRVEVVRGVEAVHVNCGFLPSSEGVWRDAWEIQRRGLRVGGSGWLHLHENVAVGDIEGRKGEIQGMVDEWGGGEVKGDVEHVELVKTFAPGVWHCVFDVCITRPSVVPGVE